MKEFDSILETVGGFGRYQLLLMIPLAYYQLPNGLNIIAPVFESYRPDFRCLMYPFDNATIYADLSNSEITNITTPTDSNGKPLNPCVRYSYPTNSCVKNRDLSCVDKSASTVHCNSYHYDDSLFNKTTVTEFNLVCDREVLDNIAASAFLVGVLVSSMVTGYILDRFGRRVPTILYSYGMLLSMLWTAYSFSVAEFTAARFLTGFFTFGSHLGTYCNVLEMVGISWRMVVGVLYHALFCLGYMLWSAVAYFYRDWHQMQLACLVISVPFALMIVMVPESPRWQFANGHYEKAEKTVNMIAKLNKRPSPPFCLLPETESLKDEKQNETVVQYSTLDLFRHSGLRKSTIKLAFYSMVNNTAYYAIAYNMGNLSGNIFLNNIYSGLLEMSGNLLCLFAVKYTGRPKLMSVAMGLVGVLLIASGILCQVEATSKVLSNLLVIFMIVAKALVSGSSAIYCCYVVEFYPTFIRGNGIGFTSTMARIGSITSPFLLGVGAYIFWVPDVVLGVASLAASVLAISLVDTTNVPLMDTIEETEIFIERRSIQRKRRELYMEI